MATGSDDCGDATRDLLNSKGKIRVRWNPDAIDLALFPITKSSMQQIVNVNNEILKYFPPSKHYYFGIGRSVTPFTALFEAAGFQNIGSMPLSKFRHWPEFDRLKGSDRVAFTPPLSEKEKAKLFAHFENYLPSEDLLEGRDLVVFDAAITGASLASVHRYIEIFYQEKGLDIRVHALPIVQDAGDLVPQARTTSYIEIGMKGLAEDLDDEAFDSFSKYGEHYVNQDSVKEKPPQKAYLELIKYIRQLMRAED